MSKRISALCLLLIGSAIFLGITGCSGQNRPSQKPRIVEKSSSHMPEWVLKPKTHTTYVYFVGGTENQPSLQQAKKAAISEATKQLIDYVGIRVTRKLSYKATTTENDNLSTFQQQIQESIEGKGNANISVDIEDTYYERYDNSTYTFYVLIKIPKKWVENERERQRKLVEQQRIISKKYLSDAQGLVKQKYYQPAIEALWQGLLISGKAAENEDVYEEIRTTLLSLYQKLSLQLTSSPSYAYTEGGSDPITVKVIDTEKNAPISGIPLEATSLNASLLAIKGTTTDTKGEITYEVKSSQVTSQVFLTITFSFTTYSNSIASDKELEEQIISLQKKNRVEITLKVSPRTKAQSTAVVILKRTKEGTKSTPYLPDEPGNTMLSSQLSDKGFNVIEIELPDIDFASKKRIKEKLLDHIRSRYPQIKRVLYVLLDLNMLGEAGNITQMSALSGMYVCEANLSYSWIDVTSNRVEEGKPIKEKGVGLNAEQAVQNSLKKSLTTLVTTLNEIATTKK